MQVAMKKQIHYKTLIR